MSGARSKRIIFVIRGRIYNNSKKIYITKFNLIAVIYNVWTLNDFTNNFIRSGIGVLVFIFWIWMLIDCLARKKFEDKLIWVIVILFLHVIGAILYYFLVKRKKNV